MQTAAITAATGTVDFTQYNRIVLVFPATSSSCTEGGLGDVGCVGATTAIPHEYSVVWLPIVSNSSLNPTKWGLAAHELGHNLGLNHANSLDFGVIPLGPIDFNTTPATGSSIAAVNTEYGDFYSVMGVAGTGPYSAEHRARILGWISAAGVRDVTASGTFLRWLRRRIPRAFERSMYFATPLLHPGCGLSFTSRLAITHRPT